MAEYSFPPVATGVTKLQGRDYNYFNKVAVNWTTFGGGNNGNPDCFISFTTQGIQFLNLGSGTTNVVEYSFNGQTVHGELNPSNATQGLTFDSRIISLIWFRLQSGSSGPVTISIQAWATPGG
jgi:hypothetical protein